MSGAPWSRVVGTVSAIGRNPSPKLIGARSTRRAEVLLNEPGTQMHVELHQRLIADRGEGVHLARLDHEHDAGTRVERLPLNRPASAASLDELDLVVRMTVRSGPSAGLSTKEKDGHADVAVVGAHEVVRAPTKGQLALAESKHGRQMSGGSQLTLE